MKLIIPDGPHHRYNPLLDSWVKVSPHRTQRPWQGKVEDAEKSQACIHDPACYLCPGNTRITGEKNPDYAQTFCFTNDFPALLPEERGQALSDQQLFGIRTVRGTCRVVCFSPRHDLTLARMPANEIEAVIRAWREEYQSLGQLDWIDHIQIFENRGEIMGCSNPHPHSQIWAENTIPDIPAKELSQQTAFFKRQGKALLDVYTDLELESGQRILDSNQSFVAMVPFWAVWPFEVLISSRRALHNLSDFSDQEITDLAVILKQVTVRYDNLFFCSFPYSMGIHQSPSKAHNFKGDRFHIHFTPPLLRSATVKKFMVGYELMCMPQRDLNPELAASLLRQCSSQHYSEQQV